MLFQERLLLSITIRGSVHGPAGSGFGIWKRYFSAQKTRRRGTGWMLAPVSYFFFFFAGFFFSVPRAA